LLLAVLALAVAGCSSSGTTPATPASPTVTSTASQTSAAKQGFALQLTGDLSGATDASSTRVSRCSTVNGQLRFEGTVALGGAELAITISTGDRPSIAVTELATDKTWTAPTIDDPAATISVHANTPMSGSVAAVASTGDPPTHLAVQGTYGC
jgi:hypothetical protein